MTGLGQPEDFWADRNEAFPSGDVAGNPQMNPNASTGDDPAGTSGEKTISCLSCRRRKLRCDRLKPKCGTCARLRHDCEYPERRRAIGSKRRNIRDLEARLAQVETRLVSETARPKTPDQIPSTQNDNADWDNIPIDVNMNIDLDSEPFAGPSFTITDTSDTYAFESTPSAECWARDISDSGAPEFLPPNEMINELYQIYFEKCHYVHPMIHKHRYMAALDLPPRLRPPIYLQYAIWATAAAVSDKYSQYDDILYERARKHATEGEMKGHGENYLTVQHAQAWGLIAYYEAKKTYFARGWMSVGRTVRLVQMLGLHRVDSDTSMNTRRILPPPKDFIELEERRRVFWAAFNGDRWSSSGTGWSMIIQENEIKTNLPSSEESFEQGVVENGVTLQEALTPGGASKISKYGGTMLAAYLFGRNFTHLHHDSLSDNPGDVANGEFWGRHRTLDNILTSTFMFLPSHLRLPEGLRDMHVVFFHMTLHTSTICLHETASVTAERHNLDQHLKRQIRSRSFMAADEIVSIMRHQSHGDLSNMNPWTGFCLYVAARAFINLPKDKSGVRTSNLKFLLAALKALGNRHSVTNHFKRQLEIDIINSGMGNELGLTSYEKRIVDGAPKSIHDLYGKVQIQDTPICKMGQLLPGILPNGVLGDVSRDMRALEDSSVFYTSRVAFPLLEPDPNPNSGAEQRQGPNQTTANQFDTLTTAQSAETPDLELNNINHAPSYNFGAFGSSPNNLDMFGEWAPNVALEKI